MYLAGEEQDDENRAANKGMHTPYMLVTVVGQVMTTPGAHGELWMHGCNLMCTLCPPVQDREKSKHTYMLPKRPDHTVHT